MKDLEIYHRVWLAAHPKRTEDWLRERLKDGFHIHHIDGNHNNNDPKNLAMIEGLDHLALHGADLRAGTQLKLFGNKRRKRAKSQQYKNGQMCYEVMAAGGFDPQTSEDVKVKAFMHSKKHGLPWPLRK